MVTRNKILAGICVAGVLLLAAGILDVLLFTFIFHNKVHQVMLLTNDTLAFKEWSTETDADTIMNIYVFNLTNPRQVLAGRERPKLREIGPFTYRLISVKNNFHWFSSQQKVNFSMSDTFYPVNGADTLAKASSVTTVNMPAWTMLNAIRYKSYFEKEALSGLFRLTGVKLFTKLTVQQMLWGYSNLLITMLHDLYPDVSPDKFGYFYGHNSTILDNLTVYTGVGDTEKINEIIAYNGKKRLTYWNTNRSNDLAGTHSGGIIPPFIHQADALNTFSFDLCRPVSAAYASDVKFRELSLWRYINRRDTLSYSDNSDNLGYCTPEGKCPPDGLLNITTCSKGAPIFMSWPHFYEGAAELRANVSGLQADRARHQSYMDVEPDLGVIPRSAYRVQVNTRIEPMPGFAPVTGSLRQAVYLPVFWYEVTSTLNAAKCRYFYAEFQRVKVAVVAFGYLLISCGLFLVLAAALYWLYLWYTGAQAGDRSRSYQKAGGTLEVAQDERTPLLLPGAANRGKLVGSDEGKESSSYEHTTDDDKHAAGSGAA